jgi:hypothetical protein
VSSDLNFDDDDNHKNLTTGSTLWISRPKTLDPDFGGDGGFGPSVSYDGRYVAFVGNADIDGANDPYPGPDVFVRDTVNKTVQRVSKTSAGGFVNGQSFDPVITGDGTRVAFASSGNASGTDTNGAKTDTFVKDLTTGKVTLVSTELFLGQLGVDSALPTLSRDGRYAGFVSAGSFAGDDKNSARDNYLRAVDVPTISSISPTSANRGTSVTITITGTTFLPGATVVPMGGVYTPTATSVNSSTSITVTLAIAAGAPTGPQSIYVQDPGTGPGSGTGGVGRCENCLTIH